MANPRPGAPRSFTVGETVHFSSRVSLAGTKTPTDPVSVTLSSLKIGEVEVLVGALPFARLVQGEYALVLQTNGLEPGTYDVVVTHSGGPNKVAIATDRFVLQSL